MKKTLAIIALLLLPLTSSAVFIVDQGGTGSTTLSGILKGNGKSMVQTAIGGTDYVVPSALSSYLSLSSWYATTTDGLDEGLTNLYFTNPRVLTYLDTLSKGYFFSTTSADYWYTVQSKASSTLLSDINIWSGLQTFGSTITTNATTTNATTSNLAVSSTISKILLTNASGVVSGYAGATCTNQFVRSISALGAATCATVGSADVSLANLTATNGTLTFSGTYNGATARTIGLNLANANTWTGGQIFGNSTTTNATSTTFFSTTASSTNLYSTLSSTTNFYFLKATGTAATTTNFFTSFITATGGLFGNIIASSSATTSLSFISSTSTKGTCIKMQDASGGTFTYMWSQSGVVYTSATSCL